MRSILPAAQLGVRHKPLRPARPLGPRHAEGNETPTDAVDHSGNSPQQGTPTIESSVSITGSSPPSRSTWSISPAELPVDHERARMWLFGIARGTLRNHARGQRKALGAR